jgi:glycogen phosphorylase
VEYVDRFYLPTARRVRACLGGDVATAEALVGWKKKIQTRWNQVQVLDIRSTSAEARIGQPFVISARLRLGELLPEDVDVQLYHGALDARDEIHDAATVSMDHVGFAEEVHSYTCKVPFKNSGRYGYTVRVIPKHRDVLIPNELEVIRWADA